MGGSGGCEGPLRWEVLQWTMHVGRSAGGRNGSKERTVSLDGGGQRLTNGIAAARALTWTYKKKAKLPITKYSCFVVGGCSICVSLLWLSKTKKTVNVKNAAGVGGMGGKKVNTER